MCLDLFCTFLWLCTTSKRQRSQSSYKLPQSQRAPGSTERPHHHNFLFLINFQWKVKSDHSRLQSRIWQTTTRDLSCGHSSLSCHCPSAWRWGRDCPVLSVWESQKSGTGENWEERGGGDGGMAEFHHQPPSPAPLFSPVAHCHHHRVLSAIPPLFKVTDFPLDITIDLCGYRGHQSPLAV